MAARMPPKVKKKNEDFSEVAEFHQQEIPEEEVKRFLIEEDLTECERVKILLKKREPNQFSYVYLNAVNIFKDDVETQSEVVPIMV